MKTWTFDKVLALLGLVSLFAVIASTAAVSAPSSVLSTAIDASVKDFSLELVRSERNDNDHVALTKRTGPGSNAEEYNQQNPNFMIPEYVLIPRDSTVFMVGTGGRQNPELGSNAVEPMFSRDQVWAAFNEGWRQIQNARRAAGVPDGRFPTVEEMQPYASTNWPSFRGGVGFPSLIARSHFDRAVDDARWAERPDFDNEQVWMFPLTYGGVFQGVQTEGEVGLFRVLFSSAGRYLGTVRVRQGLPAMNEAPIIGLPPRDRHRYSRMGWLAPVDRSANPTYVINADGSANYPGVPRFASQTPENFAPPISWRLAATLFAAWQQVRAGQGTAGGGCRSCSGGSSSMQQQQQQSTNTTSWNNYSSITTDGNGMYYFGGDYHEEEEAVRAGGGAAAADKWLGCVSGRDVVNRTYDVDCTSSWTTGGSTLDYRILVTGTGQNNGNGAAWCKGIMDNMKGQCGGNYNLGSASCDTRNMDTVVLYMDTEDGDELKNVWGIDLQLKLKWAWAESDADHTCVAQAIELGSCASRYMNPTFPTVCRKEGYYNSSITEWDWDFQGPA